MLSSLLLIAVASSGLVILIAAFIWKCVLCARQGIGWLLLTLFVPFGGLVFLVKFWSEAKRPFFLSLLGSVLVATPALLDPQGFAKGFGEGFNRGFEQARTRRLAEAGQARGGSAPATAGAPPTVSEALLREQAAMEQAEQRQRRAQETRTAFEKHRAEADVVYKDLNARRAKLKVDDAVAVAAFNALAAKYAALLEQTKTERAALDEPAAATATPAVAAAEPVVPPVAKRGPVYVPGGISGNPNGTRPTGDPVAATPAPATAGPGLYRRNLDAARAARDASAARTAEAGR